MGIVSETSLILNRRKFTIMSSAAVAAPFIANAIGKAPDAKGAEKKITYIIDSTCVGCHYCFNECPASAISWGDDKYEIDQKKCIHCGTCAEVCNISAAHAVSDTDKE
jgi:ferredoxin